MSEQKLGRYIIQDQLGEGSFAWVYKGYDEELDRHVAIKLLKPMWMADMNAVNRFKQEARTMAKLEHPNIAVVYEVGEQEGQVFLAQRLVDGNTLGARLAESGLLPWSYTTEILQQIGSALDYAHGYDMIHRDIKPANILVDKTDKAFLGDFGLVRAAEGSASISASTGGMVGTPAYMAPEQWEGKEVSPATDVYALSCVVFEMVTGRMLFNGETPATVMKQHLMEGPKFPEEWPEDVPPLITEVLKRGLAEESANRIQTAGELVEQLEKAGAGDAIEVATPVATEAAVEADEDEETVVLDAVPELEEAETPAEMPAAEAPVGAPAAEKKGGGKGLAIVGAVVGLLVVAGLAGFFLLAGGGGSDGSGEAASSSAGSEASGAVAAVDEEEPEESPTNTPVPPTDTPEPPPTDIPEPEESDVEEGSVLEEEAVLDVDELAAQADEFMNEGQFEEAIPLLDQAIELDPENAALYDMRGYSYYSVGSNDEAITDFDQSLSLSPGDPFVHNSRGLAYLNNDDNEAALADFEAAIDLDSSNGDFHWNRAEAQENLGNYEEALDGYQAAVEAYQATDTDPDYYEEAAAEAIARVEAQLGSAVAKAGSEPAQEEPAEEEEAEPAATATTAPTPTVAVASVSGHIAVPLIAGNEPRVYVADTDGNLVNTLGGARQPKHTQDGAKLVVNGDGGPRLSLRMASSDGSNDQNFGDPAFTSHLFPTWAPDGKTVAYLDKFGTQDYHMFFRTADDSPGEGDEFFAGGPIYHANSMYPQWTTGGIFFRGCSTWNGQGGDCGTWLLSGQNGTSSKVTNNANHIPTDAAGNTGLFSLNEGGNWDVYKVDLNSGSITQLTDSSSQDALGTISPDGNSVAFLSNRGGGLAVWRVSISGGEAEKLFDIPSDWGQLAGDGWSEETLSWGR